VVWHRLLGTVPFTQPSRDFRAHPAPDVVSPDVIP
jgi:hypothetical protein